MPESPNRYEKLSTYQLREHIQVVMNRANELDRLPTVPTASHPNDLEFLEGMKAGLNEVLRGLFDELKCRCG